MKKYLLILKKLLAREDYFYLALIIVSFVTALIIEDGSWQLILISVGILFLVALISSVAQKFTEYYENVPRSAFTSNVDYQVTTQSTEMGTVQTIENFDNKDEYIEMTVSNEETEEAPPKPEVKSFTGRTFDEEFSGVRIIGKKKLANQINEEGELEGIVCPVPIPIKQVTVNLDADEENIPELESEKPVETKNEQESLFTADSTYANVNEGNNESEEIKQDELLGRILSEEETKFYSTRSEFPTNTFFEVHPLFGDEPKKEMEFFIMRILLLIKSTINVNTIGLFMFDQYSNNLKLYTYLTENDQYINQNTSFPLGNDIISDIKINQKPVILAPLNLASVLDILPYYNQAIEIRSFAGIPIYQKEQVVGVLTMDSFEQNTFDNNIIAYVGNHTKLLSSLITSLNEKFELMVSAKTLEAISRFRSLLKEADTSFDHILVACFNTIKEILGFENIGFCNFSKPTNNWKVQALQGSQLFADKLTNATINPGSALIAATLFKKETLFIAPIGTAKPLVSDYEPFVSEGYFASVSLQSLNSNYGAIFVYGDNYRNITANDVKILGILAEQIASTIEKLLYINIYQSYSLVDPFSGVYTPKGLHHQLEQEIQKAKDLKTKLSFVTIQIDDYDSYKNVAGLEEAIHKLVMEFLKTRIRKYDLFGNVSDSVFGIIMLNQNYDEIRIWADQIRKEIANKVITYDNQKFMVTISVGISYLNENESIENIIKNSINMLKLSAQKKNTVNIDK